MASDPDRAEYETRYTDPLGHTTLLRHDGEGRLLSTEDPHGEVTERGWNGFEVSRLTLPDGATTTWGHFDWDEIVRRDPTGNVVHVNFRIHGGENRQDPYRRPVDRIEDSLGLVEQRHYLEGRLAWAENGATERTRFEYDAENMLASLTTPDGTTVSFSEYGEHGHAGRVAVAGEVETRVFDAVGNRVSRSGFERFDFRPGGELERGWDEARNLARISLADAALDGPSTPQEIRLSHRSDGRPTRIERPGGGDHEFVYDAAGRLAERRERVDGSWSVTHFEVDALGRTTAVTLPNGMRRETEYDASGRVRALRALRGGALETEAVLEWNAGRLRSILDARSGELEALEFDEAGLPVAIDFPGGERLEWSHDPRGRTTEEIYRLPGGAQLRRLGFDHDPADRETGVRDDGEVLVQRVYAGGRLVETHTGNGLRRRHLYDPASGLLQGSTLEHPTHGIVAATGISLEALEGGVWLRAETTSSEPASGTTVEEYLLGPSGNGPGVAGKRVLAWSDGIDFREHAYDALGNLVSGNGLRRVYNAERNRLQRIEEEASGQEVAHFEYDEAGHATARNGDAIRWTAQGFVAAVGDDAHFEWDALGRPRRRTLGGQETRLLFGGRVEADASGAPLRLDRGDVVLHLDTGERLYRHRDFRGNTFRGNTKLVSDDTGRVVAHRGYAAYGLATLTGSADESSGFAGGRPVGDLLLLGHRLHDPLAGRFLAPDPVFQIVSQHVYAHGNPVWFWDPGGLDAEPTEMPAGMQRAMLMMSVGLGYGAAGLWVGVHFSPPFGYLLGGAGVALFNRGFFELLKAIEEDQEGGPAVPGGRGGSAAPGTSGVPGGGGLQVPGLGGPEHPLSAPPNPGCPCGDGVPGGGQVGSGAQIQTGAGFGGLGGFGGF
jgi:RHS repeat-associated protein